MVVEEKKKVRPFGKLDNWAYAMGDFGCNMSFALKNTITIFYTMYIGLEASVVALIILLLNIWDGVNDPIIGAIMDRRKKGKHGKYKPFIFVGAIALIVSGAMVFLPIPKAPLAVKIIVCVLGYLVWDMAYTVVNVPYGSMASVITDDPVQRSSLSKYRTIGAFLAQIPIMIGLPMIMYKDRLDAAGNPVLDVEGVPVQDVIGFNVFLVALITGVIGFFAFMFFLKYTVERVTDEEPKEEQPKQKVSYLQTLKAFFTNRPAVGLTVASIFNLIMTQGLTTANAVLFKDYFGEADMQGVIMVASYVPMLLGIFFVNPLVKKFGKKTIVTIPMILGITASFFMMVLPIPRNMTGIIIWTLLQMCVGVSLSMFAALCWAMVSDCIDYQEMKTKQRDEGTVYAIYSLGRKVAQGLGASLVLLLMGWLGFVSAENGITPQQTPEVANNIRILIGGIQFVCSIIQFVFLTFIYNLGKKEVQDMQEALGRIKEETVVENN